MTHRRIPATNCIKGYMHCTACFDDRPHDMPPHEWSRLEAGFTKLGLQIRCKRCNLNVIHIDFEGHRHPANTYWKETL